MPSTVRKPKPPSSASARVGTSSFGKDSSMFSLVRPSTGRSPSSSSGVTPSETLASMLAARGKQQAGIKKSASTSRAPSATASTASDPVIDSNWRSGTIHLEVDLKEMVADGPACPPALDRVEKLLGLFDDFTDTATQYSSILRLFRVEFCRAIFSTLSATAGELGQIPYFEKVSTVTKDKAILEAELAAAESDSSVDELKKQIGKLQSLISFYEHEVSRLTRENKNAMEEIARMSNDIETTVHQHQVAFASLDDEVHRLTKENRELQLQVFKLGKDSRDQVAGQSLYLTMKQAKFDALQHMYQRGNEEASLLLLLNQTEAQLNKAVDEFDVELFKCSNAEIMSLRSRLVKKAGLLLEEYHHIQRRYVAIREKADEKRGDVSLLESAQNFSKEVEKGTISQASDEVLEGAAATVASGAKNAAGSELATASPSPTGSETISPPNEISAAKTKADAEAMRKRWAEKLIKSKMEPRQIQHMRAHHHEPVEPGRVMHKELTAPMLDVSSTKFMTGIELHSQMGGEATFLRNVNYIDPSMPIELPPRVTHVKLKYMNPMLRSGTRHIANPDDLPTDAEALHATTAEDIKPEIVLDWMPGKEDGKMTEAATLTEPDMDAAHWIAFRRTFLGYCPHLPRMPDIHQLDFVMMQTFQQHHTKVMQRFEHCNEIAIQRSTGSQMAKMLAERFFRDEYRSLDLQYCLLEVLEARYVFPEIVMKVAYEVLFALERNVSAHPYTKTYLSCLAGMTPPSVGYLISLNMHQLSSFWPLSTSQIDTAITERDMSTVLRCLYPAETTSVKVTTDEVLNDMIISCRKHLSLRKVKEHVSLSILSLKEPVCAKFLDMLMFRASAVHWSELDQGDFWETTRHVLMEDRYQAAQVKFLYCAAVLQKSSRVPPAELAHIAAEIVWTRTNNTN